METAFKIWIGLVVITGIAAVGGVIVEGLSRRSIKENLIGLCVLFTLLTVSFYVGNYLLP